jgi:predicted HicB family RNase H-like nuclease
MPNAPGTPLRNVRVDDALWRAAQAKAAEQGVNVSEVIRRALEHYVNGVNCPLGQ